jgi:hypothetical protein
MKAWHLSSEFRRQVRLAGFDAEPGSIHERDGMIRRSYPADPGGCRSDDGVARRWA